MQKARGHLRQAAFEGLEAARALLDAAIATSGMGQTSDASWVGNLRRTLEQLTTELRQNGTLKLPTAIAEPLAAAIDAEIARWEQRSRNDADARLVLRAFLGLRELLWEIGMRPADPQRDEKKAPDAAPPRPEKTKRARVQRFRLDD